MITVPAHRVKQFGVEFYQASFSATEIERLVKFEVLGYGGEERRRESVPDKSKRPSRTRVNWEVLEQRIGESEQAYQRPVIRRKIEELVTYYRECREAGTLPAIPGAVIITSEKRFTFIPVAAHGDLGFLQIPEEPGSFGCWTGSTASSRFTRRPRLAPSLRRSRSRRFSSTPSTLVKSSSFS